MTGCGSAWLERLVWDQEVAGSNPVTPILTNMREWLSWWSATLPRSRPRVRVPSRALLLHKKGASERMLFFSCKKSPKGSSQWHELKFIPGSRSQPTWSGLRSAQNRGPADLVRRLALFYYTKKEHPSGCSFLYHKIFSDRQVVSGWNVKVTTEVGNYIDYFVCVSLE